MAFSSSAGWSNLPQGNFVPEIYSKNVLMFFRRAAVAEAVTNTDYYGEISAFGDTVHIIKEPTITIAPYTRGKTVQVQDIDDEELTLTIDQANYFSFAVDDIEDKQAHLNWESLATSSGAYTIKNEYDKNILNYMEDQVAAGEDFVSANTIGSDSTSNASGLGATSGHIDLGFAAGEITPLQLMNRLCRLLDDQDVPEENRWFIGSPEYYELLGDEDSKLLNFDYVKDSDSKLRNGKVANGQVRGFELYKTNNAPGVSSGATTNADVVMCGHMSSTATASQIAKTESMRSERFFGDVVRGLHLFGRKTLRANAMAKAFWDAD